MKSVHLELLLKRFRFFLPLAFIVFLMWKFVYVFREELVHFVFLKLTFDRGMRQRGKSALGGESWLRDILLCLRFVLSDLHLNCKFYMASEGLFTFFSTIKVRKEKRRVVVWNPDAEQSV